MTSSRKQIKDGMYMADCICYLETNDGNPDRHCHYCWGAGRTEVMVIAGEVIRIPPTENKHDGGT